MRKIIFGREGGVFPVTDKVWVREATCDFCHKFNNVCFSMDGNKDICYDCVESLFINYKKQKKNE